mgnify:CR=1 FL=1
MKYTLLPSWIVTDTDISHAAVRTCAALCCFTSVNGIAYPNQRTLAALRDVSQPAISQQMNQLRKAGAVIDLEPVGRKHRDACTNIQSAIRKKQARGVLQGKREAKQQNDAATKLQGVSRKRQAKAKPSGQRGPCAAERCKRPCNLSEKGEEGADALAHEMRHPIFRSLEGEEVEARAGGKGGTPRPLERPQNPPNLKRYGFSLVNFLRQRQSRNQHSSYRWRGAFFFQKTTSNASSVHLQLLMCS